METYEDIEIVHKVLNGEKQLYRIIVEKYQNPIFSFLLRFTRSHSQAEDLSQESFMKAYAALNKFDTRKKLFPWLYTIAMNSARDWKRKNNIFLKSAITYTEQSNAGENSTDQEQAAANRDDVNFVNQGLMALAPELREAVVLRYRYELSIKEIAGIFNISASACKMRIHRGLKQLKEKVGCESGLE